MKPKFFATQQQFREWLEKNHASATVMSAKKEETRSARLRRLIECSARGERIGVLPSKKGHR